MNTILKETAEQESKKGNLKLAKREYIKEFLSNRYCNGIIGVPITFLDKFNPNQFKIVGRADGNIKDDAPDCYIKGFNDKGGAPLLNKKILYKRILIQLIN